MGSRVYLLSVCLLLGCAWYSPAPGPAPIPDTGDCEAAGATLSALGCPEASTPGGTSFAVACETAARDGRDWHPECIARVTSCSQVEDAFRGELCSGGAQ